MFHNDETDETSEESVVGFTPPPAPASEPSPSQLNQPPLSQTKSFEKFSIKLRKRMARLANAVVRKRMARLANEIVKLTGCLFFFYTLSLVSAPVSYDFPLPLITPLSYTFAVQDK
ncbi:hypothetical protein Pyn_24107 [Prunus yedoensis var. nudiflora]|uniref:Uncharacterized protein n=1 Tax=Prunus yedoensis var. nudiflora TaxID=2094558 RepID=A0A314Y347_PRUYE|nr:hypothetical protein Pyn_24107 [Prunus yedoensis var. nudiflora]